MTQDCKLREQGGNGKVGYRHLFVGENDEHPQANFRQQVGSLRQYPALHASCLALTLMWEMAQSCLHYLCTPEDSDICFPQRQRIILRIVIIFSMFF